MVVILNSI